MFYLINERCLTSAIATRSPTCDTWHLLRQIADTIALCTNHDSVVKRALRELKRLPKEGLNSDKTLLRLIITPAYLCRCMHGV